MFKNVAKDYIYPDETIYNVTGLNLYLPVEVDTEFTHPTYNLNHVNSKDRDICQNLTVQCRSITREVGIIYAHPEISINKPRHPKFKHGFVVVDYLESYGHQVQLYRLATWNSTANIPWLQIDMYSYFAVAELMRVFQGAYRDDVMSLIVNPCEYGIHQGRRLRTYTKAGNQLFNYVQMPWELVIDGIPYRIRLCIYDTCAVHGVASYAKFCANSNVTLEYKDIFSDRDKGMMDLMYLKRPDDFDNYALGDLYNHNALLGNMENFYKIYQSLGLSKYHTPPRLTIGATESRMIEAAIKNLFGCESDDRSAIKAFCKYACADWLKRKTTTTAWLNVKVDGGRCRNNRPIDTTVKGVIADLDISSAYGEGLRVQIYPLGVPVLIDYPIASKNNKYQTLRQFLKKYSHELVPGLWQARVSCKDNLPLTYAQDYLTSWFPPKDISTMPTDSAFAETDDWWDVDNVGEVRILNNEVHHAIITHDFIQWLDNVASVRQRKEFLDSLIIETAIYYPASERVETPNALIEAHARHKGNNVTYAESHKGKTRKIAVEEECHRWYGVKLGELLVDKLLLERKKYPKKTALNELYKLCINTLYGDMVSPFFEVGNVVVGNNITARVRGLAWCMEKGLHGWQSITDGCAFDMNKVLYPRDGRRIHGENTVNLYTNDVRYAIGFNPINETGDLSVTDNKTLVLGSNDIEDVQELPDGSKVVSDDKEPILLICEDDCLRSFSATDSLNWVNNATMAHLRNLFSGLDVLHQETQDVYGNNRLGQFEFEAKGLYDTATFHGTANYSLSFQGKTKVAMRSYSKRGHKIITGNEELIVNEDGTKPSEEFLLALTNPSSIVRGRVFLREHILKVGDFRRNYLTWKDTHVYPGCTVEVAGLLHEFSLSQFTFQTQKQYLGWRKEYEKLLRSCGQSYEMFFLNKDGTLNYQKMIETIDGYIRSGKNNFFDGLDKRQANVYRNYIKHEASECLAKVQEQLSTRYSGDRLEVTRELNDDFNDAENLDWTDY
ncbi:hypothetical protein [[Scytonema hofmanni] UTEX B 1581]|uniref:hypothetical protein n=1 Tax=[Scytonema hofmanni] UTEX B 1581 TaxID=379535 RepID=UPI000497CD41|nr:hypothetical protein [[Scytonema hofmanni] UTEX B 1581]